MRSVTLIAIIVSVLIGWSPVPIHAGLTMSEKQSLSAIETTVCTEDTMTCPVQEVRLLAQGRGKREKFDCIEACYRIRYRCERADKNRPGTRANDKASAKCQERYRNCLDRCEVPTVQ